MERRASRAAGVAEREWRDWTWQMQHRVRTRRGARALRRSRREDERRAIDALAERFRFVITPYYASLMDPDDPECPIRRQVVPRLAELDDPAGLADPLDEVAHSPVKNVIRVYPDRIAFCVNNECALYCRFCLRKRMVGDDRVGDEEARARGRARLDPRARPEIRDVLLTGGDPLVFSDDTLDWLLGELRAIPHVELIRLGTRLPVTLPFRVTDALCRMLERHHPIWVNTHFNHPKELTPRRRRPATGCTRAGIPVGNQSVLLRGINDDVATMKALCEGLVRMRVRPYYCYQAQLLEGTAHFRVPIERGVELFRALRGRTSGFAIPLYVLDTPLRQGAARRTRTCAAATATTCVVESLRRPHLARAESARERAPREALTRREVRRGRRPPPSQRGVGSLRGARRARHPREPRSPASCASARSRTTSATPRSPTR